MKTYNEFNKDINKVNVDKAIQHDWATHIHHPSLGEVKVESHSLTENGEIEEYHIVLQGKEYTFNAEDVKVTQMQEHQHGPKPISSSKKKKKKWKTLNNTLQNKNHLTLPKIGDMKTQECMQKI